MCIALPRSSWSRRTVRACETGITTRDYDCKNCEHYHVDCEFSDVVEQALKTRDTSNLPALVAEKLDFKIADELLAEAEELKKTWKPKLDPKRLP